MISRKHRFHGHNSLSYVYRNGQTVRGPLFSVKSTVNPQRQTYRLAVVISRKVNKSAVARNRIRRRLYEIVRNMDDGITKPYDIVITLFNDVTKETSHQDLSQQVKSQFQAAGIIGK